MENDEAKFEIYLKQFEKSLSAKVPVQRQLAFSTMKQLSERLFYNVMAPLLIYPNSPYSVAMTTRGCNISSTYLLNIVGPDFSVKANLNLTVDSPTKWHVFKISEIDTGLYILRVTTVRGCYVQNSTLLRWRNTKIFIKIQTPKFFFYPGQLLQFRVFFHDDQMHYATPDLKTSIMIEDAKGYNVKVFQQLTITKGIFEGQMRLSPQVHLGRWRICVLDRHFVIEVCEYIKVVNYKLSELNVSLSAPFEVNLDDGKFNAVVKITHEFNGPVKYNITMYISIYTANKIEEYLKVVHAATNSKNGEATIEVDLTRFNKSLSTKVASQLKLTVSLHEIFKENVINETRIVTVWGKHQHFNTENVTRKMRSQRSNVIQIKSFGKQMNETLKLHFSFNETVEVAHCMVLINNLILGMNDVYPDESKTNITISLTLTSKMWPLIYVIVYCMDIHSKTLMLASQILEVDPPQNVGVFIDIPLYVTPDHEIQFSIKAKNNCYVGIEASDNRVFNLGAHGNNDFNEDYLNYIRLILIGYRPDILTMEHGIVKSGLVVLSNAHRTSNIHLKRIKIMRPVKDYNITHISPFKADRDNPEGEIIKYVCCDVPQITPEMEDVWLFKSIKNTNSEWSTWKATVPNTANNWRISAFAIHSETGLHYLSPKPFVKVTSFSTLHYSLRVPYSIRLEEALELHFLCSNWFSTGQKVYVDIYPNNQFELVNRHLTVIPNVQRGLFILSNTTEKFTFYIRALRPGTIKLKFVIRSHIEQHKLNLDIEVLKNISLSTHEVTYYRELESRQYDSNAKLYFPHIPNKDGVTCFASGQVIAHMLKRKINVFDETDNTEQLISKLFSIYYLWNYVVNMTVISPSYKNYLVDQLSCGYQSLMRLRKANGGYRNNISPQVTCAPKWLTTYVIRLLYQLENYPAIILNTSLIEGTENFLMKNRGEDGHFRENCYTQSRRNLTFLELNIEIIKVLQFSNRLIYLHDIQEWMNWMMETKFEYYSEAKRGLNPVKWQLPSELDNWVLYRRELETAGRILSTELSLPSINQKDLIFEWLVSQIADTSQHVYCYECSIAEEAFFGYLNYRGYVESNLTVWIWVNSTKMDRFYINADNQWEELSILLYPTENFVRFRVKGKGLIFLRCTYNYVAEPAKLQLYHTTINFISKTQIKFCVQRFLRIRKYYAGTNIEIVLPSGYVLGDGTVPALMTRKLIIQANSINQKSKLFLTMDQLPPGNLYCYNFTALPYYRVLNLQNATMTTYDINEQLRSRVVTFNKFKESVPSV